MAQRPIPVALTGASGRMAQEALNAIGRDPQLRLVGASSRRLGDSTLPLPEGGSLPLFRSLEALLDKAKARVLVDFTVASAAMDHARLAFRHRVSPVIGTSGLSSENLRELEELSRSTGVGAIVAPNFALGAVLMIHLARLAAPYFECVEIVELHHEGKIDAPSGTALATAQAMAQARGKPFQWKAPLKETLASARGAQLEGVGIHSVRLPGLVAHQEVIFGTTGQTLSLRHDSISRESFMPGLLLAIKEVVKRDHLVMGLEKVLGLA